MILGYRLAGLVGALGLTSAGALLLFFLSYRLNVRVIQLQLLRIDWKKIEEILPYCLFSLLSAFFLAAQASMPVWLLSLADELSQVAYLGISVQVLLSLRGVYAAVWQALLPILSTLEERDEKARLAQWISLLMRVTTVLFTVVALFWLFTGQQLTLWVFGSGYGAVYPCLLFVLVASTLFSTGACVNGLLQVKKRTGLSALNHFVFLCSTLFGIYLLNDDWRGIDALGICRVFIWSSGLFFVSSYVTLGLFEKSWIPVVRGSVLLIPVLLIPALWDATGEIVLRFDMAILYLLLYLVIVVVAQLVRFSELRYAWSMLRG
jgi:O-antigen/teichoic acid export membrane protein